MDFLKTVVPGEGETVLAYIHPWRTTRTGAPLFVHEWLPLHDTKAVVATVRDWVRQGLDCYFAMASFDDKKRQKEHAQALKCVWMDLDAGKEKYAKRPTKVYRTALEALDDLDAWLDEERIPDPTYIVSSGRGLHVYWALTESVGPDDWLTLSGSLVGAAVDWGLKVDPGPSKNRVGVLRVPGTLHTKSGKTVRIIQKGDVHDYDDFLSALPKVRRAPASALGNMPDHLRQRESTKRWDTGDTAKSFKQILLKSLKSDKGCAQIRYIATEQPSIEEPLWRAGLSIAQNCESPQKWAHVISNQHPDYSAEETDAKRLALEGKPYTCSSFNDLQPGICKSCPHRGKITSPIQLGRVYVDTTDMRDLQERRQRDLGNEAPPATKPAKKDAGDEVTFTRPDQVKSKPIDGVSPPKKSKKHSSAGDMELDPLDWTPPFPFFRKKGGGLIRRDKTDEGTEDTLVYEHDVVALDRVFANREEGDVMILEMYLPHDSMREVRIPYADLTASDDALLKHIAKAGYSDSNKGRRTMMATFLRTCAKEMVNQKGAQQATTTLGWNSDNQRFVLGNRSYDKEGPKRAVTAEDLDMLVESTTLPPTADLRRWADLVDMYNHPGMEAAQFVVVASLAAPLFRLRNINGPIVHLYSEASGSGKTSAARVGLSVWGRPTRKSDRMGLESTAKDTENSLRTRLVQQNSFPMSVDEITNMGDERLSDLVYEFTQGTEKQRATAAGGLNNKMGTWDTCMFTTGNRSLFDRLSSAKARNALMARFLEIDFDQMDSLRKYMSASEVDENLAELQTEQYAVLGHVFSRWLVGHRSEATDILREAEELVDQVMAFEQSERYWRGMMICAVAAYWIGRDLGAWDFDEKRILRFMRDLIRQQRKDTEEVTGDRMDAVYDYLTAHTSNTLYVDANGHVLTAEVRDAVIARVDRQTRQLYLVRRPFTEWMSKAGYAARSVERHLEAQGAEMGRYRVAAGTKMATGRPHVIAIPLELLDSSFIDDNEETEDGEKS